jgi:hypothetical protein
VLRNTDMSQLAQVRSARAKVAGNDGEQVEEADDIAGHKVLIASAPVAPLGWLVFVETPVQEAYAPLYASLQRTGLILLGALALAFAAGMFLARRMVVPIHAGSHGSANRIAASDSSVARSGFCELSARSLGHGGACSLWRSRPRSPES